MEKQLSFQLEGCPPCKPKRQQKTEKPKQPDTAIKQLLSEQLPSPKEEIKLGPLSLEEDTREKHFSEATTLKENSPEQTPEKERFLWQFNKCKNCCGIVGRCSQDNS